MIKHSSRILLFVAVGFVLFPASSRGGTTDGSCLEPWELQNFQPSSPTHGQTVKSSSYASRPTIVLFLSSW